MLTESTGVWPHANREFPADPWRESTIGELLIQVAMAFGLLGCLRWLCELVGGMRLAAVVPAAASAWVICRGTGMGHSQPVIAAIELFGAVLLLVIEQFVQPAASGAGLLHGPFSPRGIAACWFVLGVVDAFAVARWWWRSPESSQAKQLEHNLRQMMWIALGLGLLGLVIGPWTQQWWQNRQPQPTSYEVTEMTASEAGILQLLATLAAAWFAFLGATIGSFLNVAAWRIPRNQTVILGGSHCPACQHAIERRDNIPLWGWFRLRGRCRHCNTPISLRYPLVELITLGLFLLIYFRELISGGANLPQRKPYVNTGVVWILFYTKWELLGLALFHAILLGWLLVWSLIDHDGLRIPSGSIARTLAATALVLLLIPAWQLVPWSQPLSPGIKPLSGLQAMVSPAVGLLVGLFAGWLICQLDSRPGGAADTDATRSNLLATFLLLGLGWGWQAVLPLAALLIPTRRLLQINLGHRVSPVATLAVLILGYHLTWNFWPPAWSLLR